MPRIPKVTTTGPRQQSVGRMRINAPVEAFGGGAAAQGIAQVGAGLQSVGKGVERVQERRDNSDVVSAKTAASNIYNKYSILAKRAKSGEEVQELYEKAYKEASGLTGTARSGAAKSQISEWLIGEKGRRDNQQMSIAFEVEDRNTIAKLDMSRDEAKTSSIDDGSLANNKMKISEAWNLYPNLTEGEVQKGIANDFRMAELSLAGKYLNGIDYQNDTWQEQEAKLAKYEQFIENTNSITEEDKANAKINIQKSEQRIKNAFESQLANGIVGSILPRNIAESDEIKSEEGQQALMDRAKVHIDTNKDVGTPEQRARLTGRVNSILQAEFQRFNAARKQEVSDQLVDPNSNLEQFAENESLSNDERKKVLDAFRYRQDVAKQQVIRRGMNNAIEKFDFENAKPDDMINLYAQVQSLSAPERKVYSELIENKMDALENKPVSYQKAFSKLESLLMKRYKLTGSSPSDDTMDMETRGLDRDMDRTERTFLMLKDLRVLREIADKAGDNIGVFDTEAKKFMDAKSEEYIKYSGKVKYKENK